MVHCSTRTTAVLSTASTSVRGWIRLDARCPARSGAAGASSCTSWSSTSTSRRSSSSWSLPAAWLLYEATLFSLSLSSTVLLYLKTSGLPGRRPVTPRACVVRRLSIRPLHRSRIELATVVPRACPVPFLEIAPQASAGERAKPVLPVRWPRSISQPHDFLEIGNFAPFSETLHIKEFKGRNFPNFFIRSRLHMTPMNRAKFHGNRSALFSEIRNTDTQTRTDRRGNFIYIYRRQLVVLIHF